MEPFMQVCPTCQSRIRVRNPNMIGQIANCPKCSSLIMIAAPKQVLVQGPQGAADSNTVTREAIPGIKPTDSKNTAADPNLHNSAAFESGRATEQPIIWQPADRPLIPSEQWTSPSATRSRQILMVVFLGVTGSVAAAGLFYSFIRWASNSGPRSSTAPSAPVSPPETAVSNPSSEQATASLKKGANMLIEPSVAEKIAADVEPSETPLTPMAGLNQPATITPNAIASAPGNSPTSSVPTVESSNRESPTDLLSGSASSPNSADVEAAKRALPAALAEIQSIFEMSLNPSMNDAGVELSAPPKAIDDAATADSSGTSNDSDSDASEVLNKLRAVELRAIAIGDRPLPDAIAALVQLTNIPITIDFDSLAAAGIDRNQTIDLKIQKTTVEGILETFVEGKNLEFRALENSYLALRATDELLAKRVANSVSLGDLIRANDTKWQQSLVDLFSEKRGNWQLLDGWLRSDASEPFDGAWLQCIALVEDWRVLNSGGAGLESPMASKSTWVVPSDILALSHICMGISSEPQPLGQALVRACREASIECWLDWPSLIDDGLTPDTTELIVTNNRPLKDILAAFAEKHDLVFALEDRRTIFVTTKGAHSLQLRSYVRAAEGKSAEEWVAELSQWMPPNSAAKNSIRTVLSPDSKFVLIRAPRPAFAR